MGLPLGQPGSEAISSGGCLHHRPSSEGGFTGSGLRDLDRVACMAFFRGSILSCRSGLLERKKKSNGVAVCIALMCNWFSQPKQSKDLLLSRSTRVLRLISPPSYPTNSTRRYPPGSAGPALQPSGQGNINVISWRFLEVRGWALPSFASSKAASYSNLRGTVELFP